jgi:hypothetical protein
VLTLIRPHLVCDHHAGNLWHVVRPTASCNERSEHEPCAYADEQARVWQPGPPAAADASDISDLEQSKN